MRDPTELSACQQPLSSQNSVFSVTPCQSREFPRGGSMIVAKSRLCSKLLSQGEESWKHSSDRRRGEETHATKPEHCRRRRRNVSGHPAADLLIRGQRLPRKIRQSGRGGPSRPYRTQQYTGQIFLSFPHGEELLGRPQQPVFFIAGVEALFE